jgi:adenosylhomocysteinase
VLAVNETLTERVFNDRYGTGQSTLDGILRATNLLLAGRAVVVLGYGSAGRGVAQRAKGAGAVVIVCEVDPVRGARGADGGLRGDVRARRGRRRRGLHHCHRRARTCCAASTSS